VAVPEGEELGHLLDTRLSFAYFDNSAEWVDICDRASSLAEAVVVESVGVDVEAREVVDAAVFQDEKDAVVFQDR
jgi:hypothetical protein